MVESNTHLLRVPDDMFNSLAMLRMERVPRCRVFEQCLLLEFGGVMGMRFSVHEMSLALRITRGNRKRQLF